MKISKNGKKKPFFLRWWFILLVIIVIGGGALSSKTSGEKIKWDDIVMGELLPEPPANKGEIHFNSSEELWVDINKISEKQFDEYIGECKEYGFTVDAEKDSMSYDAYNEDGYKLSLMYSSYGEKLTIELDVPMEMGKLKWPSSKAGKQIPAPKSETGKFEYEYDDNFLVYVGDTSKADYEDYIDACIDAGFNVDYDKGDNHYYADNEAGWHISLSYEGNNIMRVDIDAPDEEETKTDGTTDEKVDDSEEETEAQETTEKFDDSVLGAEFKAAMDSYETFMNEYVDFMKKYQDNPSDISLIGDYADYVKKYSDFVDDFEKWEDEEMNTAETAYYIDVQARVSKKLLEIAE